MSTPSADEKKVKLWDFPVRLFHWALVVAIVTAWWSNRQVMIDIHAIAGYSVLTLVIFRIIWGFIGSSNARFADFLTGPRHVIGYLGKLPKGSTSELTYTGHNPAGGWMVLVMILLVGVQAVSGLFASEDTFLFFDGPLVAYVSSDFASTMNWIHHTNINLIYAAVGLHVFAALFYLVVKRENLIRAIVIGTRRVPAELAGRFANIRFASPVLGIVILIVCALVVWGGVTLARG
ncbi:MAG: cytochrome b/b6 domain-containing protein [Thalassospira sp.]|uniref:cytochrome b/b6 domain-containing protein n=1 Tax=Thalassospira sp. TaxID=1912094 RepID=UPI001B166F0D|nr:cytochrome b/b6 domain-containing protein [Thalassospira sp.]MBO6580842.1 cytochrome b/b6 domain-containing protein [Thalassospira sp.]MBO6802555.1 cytochrome b/b6 domain-containing protein [Thalassospira sp.]MBO6819927.1 cytochrome b/b6 domain-containing protein [Thalassospira sp.]MBO6889143.1 cytochrome b/b6 domain-containing protein [Thalassospira sp.]